MMLNHNGDKFPTTIGELIVALSDAAFEVCKEKRAAYFLVALALDHLLRRAHRDKKSMPTRLAAGAETGRKSFCASNRQSAREPFYRQAKASGNPGGRMGFTFGGKNFAKSKEQQEGAPGVLRSQIFR